MLVGDLAKLPTSYETERLLVRKLNLNDDEAFYAAARESINEAFPFLSWCHPDYSIDETRQWLASMHSNWQSSNSHSFVITEKGNGRIIGGIGLNRIDENPVANLGYWIRTSACGQGIATEASIGLANFGFKYMGLIRIEIVMSVANIASRKVAENIHAHLEGILRSRLLLQGSAHDAYSYSLLRSDLNDSQVAEGS